MIPPPNTANIKTMLGLRLPRRIPSDDGQITSTPTTSSSSVPPPKGDQQMEEEEQMMDIMVPREGLLFGQLPGRQISLYTLTLILP
jgi:hypothetical protein